MAMLHQQQQQRHQLQSQAKHLDGFESQLEMFREYLSIFNYLEESNDGKFTFDIDNF